MQKRIIFQIKLVLVILFFSVINISFADSLKDADNSSLYIFGLIERAQKIYENVFDSWINGRSYERFNDEIGEMKDSMKIQTENENILNYQHYCGIAEELMIGIEDFNKRLSVKDPYNSSDIIKGFYLYEEALNRLFRISSKYYQIKKKKYEEILIREIEDEKTKKFIMKNIKMADLDLNTSFVINCMNVNFLKFYQKKLNLSQVKKNYKLMLEKCDINDKISNEIKIICFDDPQEYKRIKLNNENLRLCIESFYNFMIKPSKQSNKSYVNNCNIFSKSNDDSNY